MLFLVLRLSCTQVTGIFVASGWYYGVMKFDHLPQFTICDTKSEEYGEWVDKTARLLKRPYAQMHLLFTREKWTLEKIRDRYTYCTKHNGDIPSHILWWYLRRKDNGL